MERYIGFNYCLYVLCGSGDIEEMLETKPYFSYGDRQFIYRNQGKIMIKDCGITMSMTIVSLLMKIQIRILRKYS